MPRKQTLNQTIWSAQRKINSQKNKKAKIEMGNAAALANLRNPTKKKKKPAPKAEQDISGAS